MSDKVYFNSITIKEGKYGLKISINYNKFIQEAQNHLNDKGYLNLDINKRKEAGKYGETHYATLNTWKPEKKEVVAKDEIDEIAPEDLTDNQDLPF